MIASVAASSYHSETNRSVAGLAGGSSRPRLRSSAMAPSSRSPSRSYTSKSNRSRLEGIWMSIDGEMVSTTSPSSRTPAMKNRSRTLLLLLPTISRSTGAPMQAAPYPE